MFTQGRCWDCLSFLCEMVPDILDWADEGCDCAAPGIRLRGGKSSSCRCCRQHAIQMLWTKWVAPLSVAVNAGRMGCVQILKLHAGGYFDSDGKPNL